MILRDLTEKSADNNKCCKFESLILCHKENPVFVMNTGFFVILGGFMK